MSKEENKPTAQDVVGQAEYVIQHQFDYCPMEVHLYCGENTQDDCEHTCGEFLVVFEGTQATFEGEEAFYEAFDAGWTIRHEVEEESGLLIVTWLCPKCSDPDFKWPKDWVNGGEE